MREDITSLFEGEVEAVKGDIAKRTSDMMSAMVGKPSVADATPTKAVRTHSSGNPAVFMLPFYALMVTAVMNWVQNDLPKLMRR